jgi:ABC-2 type transport system permease protein
VGELAVLYARLVGARVRGQLEYRGSLALQVVATATITIVDFVAILVIFQNVPALDGWRLEEVALLYGIATISFAFTDLAIGHLDLFPQMIRDGTFDLLLVRPLPSLLQVIASDFSLRRIGKVAQGVAVLVYALAHVDVDWTLGRAALLPVAILSGAVLYAAVWIALATIAFWIVDAIEVVNAFTYGGNFLSQYPISIFGRWLRSLVLFAIPLAFVAVRALLGKDGIGPAELGYAAPLVAALASVVAYLVWERAVRRYRSAGG